MVTKPVEGSERDAARLEENKALYQGFGNALALAVELAAVPVMFLLSGVWLDGRLDTRPVFAIVLGAIAVVGVAVRSYYAYQERMRLEEEGKPWARPRP